eukprot:CAMPEP_0170455374 /NCGR_PEP_ID=MMETSP0123-20130129/3361_1 /TAXON_ID=182087 /ORGANISM="Favella ehrenbergii, Strain Fehren 1" /LENGTH=101 /DNA_ID=CAMNT_0010718493 /DNA_START=1340 /DNA_END=1641 /DNA_ORIENTATION=+
MGAVVSYEHARRKSLPSFPFVIIGFILGFAFNICFIPAVLLFTACWLIVAFLVGIIALFETITGIRIRGRGARPLFNTNPAAENMRLAQERMREREANGET